MCWWKPIHQKTLGKRRLLINEGIKANAGLFNKISDITDQIAALKSQLKESVNM
jgi:hypothetical protein